MGRPLRLACDNCIRGDVSAWYGPFALVLIACAVGTAIAFTVALQRDGRRGTLLWLAGWAMVCGPPVAIVGMTSDIRWERTYCGSALDASLTRPRPGARLDLAQEGCRAEGARVVRFATGWAGLTTVVAVGSLAGAALPVRRRATV